MSGGPNLANDTVSVRYLRFFGAQFRIGVNVGDDIYGDGVNVAARLESLAEPGGICVSESVRAAIGNKLPLDYQDIGLQQVKSIDEPIHAYHVLVDAAGLPRRTRKTSVSKTIIAGSMAALALVVVVVTWFGPVRINAQLIDATTNHHVWADRYDLELDNIFSVQDEITNTVVTSLHVMLTEGEQERVASRHTAVVEAYDLYLRGQTYLRGTKQTHAKARQLFDEALKLDPEFAAVYADKSFTYFSSFIMPMSRDPKVIAAAVETAERAVALDNSLPLAHARLAWAYFASRQHDKAIEHARQAVSVGPNDAEAHAQLGNVLNWSGNPQEGMRYIEKAMRLNPHYPYYYLFYLGHSHYLLEDREEAIALMKRVVTRAPYFLPVRRHLAVLFTEIGLQEEAKAQTEEVLRIFPGASIEDESARCFYKWTPPLMDRFFDGLRQSGMPEGVAGEEPMSM